MKRRDVALLCLAGVVLYVAGYHLSWPLIFVALAPVAAAFRCVNSNRAAIVLAYFTGWAAMFLVQHPLWVFRSSAVATLAACQALTWIPIALAVRGAWSRWGLPLNWSWPVGWTAGECLRLLGPLGSPFGALFAPCAEMPRMLQIGELGGMHLASLPIAMAQGWAAEFLIRRFGWVCDAGRRGEGVRAMRVSGAVVAGVWILVPAYGCVRFAQVEQASRPGPRVAAIQPDIPHVAGAAPDYDLVLLREKLQRLSEEAVAKEGLPDLVVWPEAIAEFPLHNRAFLEAPYDPRMNKGLRLEAGKVKEGSAHWESVRRAAEMEETKFSQWVRDLGAPTLVGMKAYAPAPPGRADAFLLHNAAVRFDPEAGQSVDFQAKARLYPAGESAPWRGTWLESILGRPSADYTPGEVRRVYRLKPDGPAYIVRICSEMKFPKLTGRLEGGDDFDFIVSPANEGMFLRNRAQVALRDCAVYRAIERRVGVVRASNSGVSGFVAPSGRSHGQVRNAEGRTRAGLGAPELTLIRELLEFRARHEAGFSTSATLRAELDRRIAEVEAVRSRAGIEGWTVDRVQLADVRTPFERFGDWLTPTLVSLLALMVFAAFAPEPRR